jgi:pimeloyl-ACP methyl ester carboxylesterase
MQTFTSDDGERLNLGISGDGPPVVLLHGWTSSRAAWLPVSKDLSRRYRVLCPDARGHGGHVPNATRAPDVKRLAADLLALLDRYGIDRAVAVGHSMGALTLWQFIRDHGCERLSRICIIDQSPRLITDETWQLGIYGDFDRARSTVLDAELNSDFAEGVLRLIAGGLNARAADGYARNTKGWQQARRALQALDAEILITIWRSLVAADFRDVLPAITVPTWLAWGTASNFYPVDVGRYLLSSIRGSSMTCYEGADHAPHLQNPDRFSADLIEFIES